MPTLYHTSPSEITTITQSGMFGECLCFSANIYQMSACDVITYRMDIDDSDIVEARTFFYRDDCGKLSGIIDEIMALADCDKDAAEEMLSQRERHGDAEIDWRIQGYAGEAARALGYKAAESEDEQGTVYIVPMLGRESNLLKLN